MMFKISSLDSFDMMNEQVNQNGALSIIAICRYFTESQKTMDMHLVYF